MKSIKLNQNEVVIKNGNNYIFKLFMIFLLLFFNINQAKAINKLKNICKNINEDKIDKNYDSNFKYHLYENEMIKYSEWFMKRNEAYFLNNICSDVIILNALRDSNDSFLVSLDLNSYKN